MIELKNPLTREQFETGHPFLVYYNVNMGALKYRPGNDKGLPGSLEKAGSNIYTYVCNVSKVDQAGFNWHGSFLGKQIKGRVLFATCIPTTVQSN